MTKKTYTKNAKHQIPPISWKNKETGERDYMQVDKPYAFSYNPERQPQERQVPLLWSPYYNDMSNLFYSMKHCEINVVSEFGAYGRWHFHGTIYIKDILKFYVYDLPVLRRHGALEIDTIEDMDEWNDYCLKEQLLVDTFLKERNATGDIDTSKPRPKNVRIYTPAEPEVKQMIVIEESDSDSDKSFDSEGGKWSRKFWDT